MFFQPFDVLVPDVSAGSDLIADLIELLFRQSTLVYFVAVAAADCEFHFFSPWLSMYARITSTVVPPVVSRQYDGDQIFSFQSLFLTCGYLVLIVLLVAALYALMNLDSWLLGQALNRKWIWSLSLLASSRIM